MKTTAVLAACLVSALAPVAMGQFTSDPGAQYVISGGAGDQTVPHWALAPDGTYWVYYWNQTGSGYQDWVTRINPDGTPPAGWSAAGMVYHPDTQSSTAFQPTGVVDAAGNFIVVYTNNTTPPTQISIQKISPAGDMLFGPTGISVTAGTTAAGNPTVCVTSDGDYVVGYNRTVGVLQANGSTAQKQRCFYQRFSSTGTPEWAGDGLMMTPDFTFWDSNITPTSTEANKAHYTYGFQNFGVVASDGGSAIVCMVSFNGTTGIRRIAVQKLDTAGAAQWNSGAEVPVSTANSMSFPTIPTFITDGMNGAVIGWYDGTTSTSRARVQRVDSAGTLLFPANGATTSSNAAQLQTSPSFIFDTAAARVYAITQEQNTTQSIRGVNVQAFDSTGARLFGDEGVVVVPMLPTLPGDGTGNVPQFVRLGLTSGGVIASWLKGVDTSGSQQMIVLASKVSDEGAVAWGPITVNSNSSVPKGRLDIAPIPGGGVIDFYMSGPGLQADVMGSRINDDGTLGNPDACPGGQCGPQDYNGDGDAGTDQDIEAFFACLGGNCCPLCFCQGSDFNGDGDVGTDQDIEAFFRVLGGSPC